MRKIILSGDINEESFAEFCEQMDELENVPSGAKTDDIELVLNSTGGNALDAVAFMSRMRLSPCDVNVTVFGLAGSAAVLILASGDYRRMTQESWVMVHEDSASYRAVTTSQLEKEAIMARKFEDQWDEIMERVSGTKKDVWKELHRNGDLYLTPKECVSLGICDEVV